jgi:hypothetical protein
MAGHTLGPLTYKFEEDGGYDCMTDSWDIYKGDTIVVEVDLRHFGGREDEAEAYARLVTASPKMLVMLKRCVERIQHYENPENVVSVVQLDSLDVIAEAEGR